MKSITAILKPSPDFMAQVLNFYKVNFWDRMGGDLLPYPLAYMMFACREHWRWARPSSTCKSA